MNLIVLTLREIKSTLMVSPSIIRCRLIEGESTVAWRDFGAPGAAGIAQAGRSIKALGISSERRHALDLSMNLTPRYTLAGSRSNAALELEGMYEPDIDRLLLQELADRANVVARGAGDALATFGRALFDLADVLDGVGAPGPGDLPGSAGERLRSGETRRLIDLAVWKAANQNGRPFR